MPTEIKQSVLTFSKGQFALKSDSNVASEKPWDSFLKTNPKTEKMRFFSQVTQEIYELAFIHKQTQFRSYLNEQRQFRWEISQQIENLTDISGYYEQCLIIKENIKFQRYLTLPRDPTLKDASQAGRTLQHVQSTRLNIDEIQERLRNRNSELHERDDKIRKWASNEFNVIHQYLSSLRELRKKISQLEDNLSHVTKILQQKFDSHAVCDFDEKRKKKQRKIQQKAKTKESKNYFSKKCKTVSCPK